MAKRQLTNNRKKVTEKPQFFCKDCRHSYDWNSKALDGHWILCRCPYDKRTEYGRWCKFLSDPMCNHFELRSDGEEPQIRQMGNAAQA